MNQYSGNNEYLICDERLLCSKIIQKIYTTIILIGTDYELKQEACRPI